MAASVLKGNSAHTRTAFKLTTVFSRRRTAASRQLHSLTCAQNKAHLSRSKVTRGIRDRQVCCARNRRPAGKTSETTLVEIDEDASNCWRLEEVVEIVESGGVGIIPTDSCYAFVCDVHNSKAIDKMYRIKDMDASKPLSILCRNFNDIDTYTNGFPAGGDESPNTFRVAKKCLPGAYTFILQASKELPKRCFDVGGKKQCKFRKCVGVRIPGDEICLALLSRLHAPLLCTSVPATNGEMQDDPIAMLDKFGKLGLDFVVDGGTRIAEPSSVIDLSSGSPLILREGKGDISMWDLGAESSGALAAAYA